MRVLVVPDTTVSGYRLRAVLEERRFGVTIARDGEIGLVRLIHGGYDIAIVDANAPGCGGLAVVQGARGAGVPTFIVMLDADGSALRRVAGLKGGADDYLVKPVAAAELIARMNALARRVLPRVEVRSIAVGALRIDVSGYHASYRGRSLSLSITEFRVLVCLAAEAGHVLTRTYLLKRAWTRDLAVATNTVDVCIGSLRRKLLSAGATIPIVTVRGVGFKLAEQP
jgi:two-component system OmpR family response regulator